MSPGDLGTSARGHNWFVTVRNGAVTALKDDVGPMDRDPTKDPACRPPNDD
jgi:hypothetical protein